MCRIAARLALACALAFVLGACTTFGSHVRLGTDEKGWTQAGKPLGSALEWRGEETSLLVAAEIVPCELPFTVSVTNRSPGELRVLVDRVVPSDDTGREMGTWLVQGALDGPRRFGAGEEIVVPGTAADGTLGTVTVALPADREWTTREPVREGDTISYDLVIRRGDAESRLPLRFEVVHVGSDFRWWTPLLIAGFIAGAIAAPELTLRLVANGL